MFEDLEFDCNSVGDDLATEKCTEIINTTSFRSLNLTNINKPRRKQFPNKWFDKDCHNLRKHQNKLSNVKYRNLHDNNLRQQYHTVKNLLEFFRILCFSSKGNFSILLRRSFCMSVNSCICT